MYFTSDNFNQYFNDITGVELSSSAIAKLLTKMSLPSTVSKEDPDKIVVEIGPTRHDILHACDIIGKNLNLWMHFNKASYFTTGGRVYKLCDSH